MVSTERCNLKPTPVENDIGEQGICVNIQERCEGETQLKRDIYS